MSWRPTKTRKIKRIENGEFFIELQAMSQGDRDELLDVLIKMDISNMDSKKLKDSKSAESGAKMQLGAMRHFQRVRSIKSWNLRYYDEDQEKYTDLIPLTEEAIKNLPPEIVAEIDEGIAELNPQLSDAKKNE